MWFLQARRGLLFTIINHNHVTQIAMPKPKGLLFIHISTNLIRLKRIFRKITGFCRTNFAVLRGIFVLRRKSSRQVTQGWEVVAQLTYESCKLRSICVDEFGAKIIACLAGAYIWSITTQSYLSFYVPCGIRAFMYSETCVTEFIKDDPA